MNNVKPGCLYRRKRRWPNKNIRNDQQYGWCIPIHQADGSYVMLDTYQIHSYSCKEGETRTDGAIRSCIEFGANDYEGWVSRQALGDFYFKNQEKVNSNFDDNYEFICDLSEYRGLKIGECAKDYQESDRIDGVQLYFEHGYSWNYGPRGVSIIKKDAQKSDLCKAKRLIHETFCNFTLPYSGIGIELEQVESMINNGLELPPTEMLKFTTYKNLMTTLKQQRTTINEIIDTLNEKLREIEKEDELNNEI